MFNPSEVGRRGAKSTRYTYRWSAKDVAKAAGKSLNAVRCAVYQHDLRLHDLPTLAQYIVTCREKLARKEAMANRKKQQASKPHAPSGYEKASPPKETGQ